MERGSMIQTKRYHDANESEHDFCFYVSDVVCFERGAYDKTEIYLKGIGMVIISEKFEEVERTLRILRGN